MGKTAKVLLTVAGVSFLVVAGTCGAGWFWIQQNQEELREEGKAAMKDGARFGSGKPAQACIDEGLTRLDAISGVVAEATNKVWVAACLKTANVDDAFCAGTPPRDEIMASATWSIERCKKAGREGSQPCTRLVGAIQERCLTPRPTRPSGP